MNDFERRQRLAGLLVDHDLRLPDAEMLFLRLQEDEDVGAPEAAWTLLRLLEARQEQFRDDELIFEVITRNKAKDDRIALADAEYLAAWSEGDSDAADLFAKNAGRTIDALAEKGMGAAWTLKGQLQRKGWVYRRTTSPPPSPAEGGRARRPRGHGRAGRGLRRRARRAGGPAQRLRWLRTAAAQGWVEARKDLVWQFKFDTFERKMTLREVTETVALYGDGLGYIDPSSSTRFSATAAWTISSARR